VGIYFFIITVFGSYLNNLYGRVFPSLNFEVPDEDAEHLDTYFNVLKPQDREWSIKEEEYYRGETQGDNMKDL